MNSAFASNGMCCQAAHVSPTLVPAMSRPELAATSYLPSDDVRPLSGVTIVVWTPVTSSIADI